jgi:peroxiredoxin
MDMGRGFVMKKRRLFLITASFVFALAVSFTLLNRHAEGLNPWPLEKTIGQKAPELVLKDLSGRKVSTASFKGKTVLLNFWATWCSYCRKERAELNALHMKYSEKNLVILSVSIDKSAGKLKSYMKQQPADFIVLSDIEGESSRSYEIAGLPTTYLIDDKGIIRHKFVGYKKWTSAYSEKIIDRLIN